MSDEYSPEEEASSMGILLPPEPDTVVDIGEVDASDWKKFPDIITDSLWIFGSRSREGMHDGKYHGNFVPQIPFQAIRRFTRPGDVVLDTFLGSGTTLIECRRQGRQGIGIELIAPIALDASERIQAEANPYSTSQEVLVGDTTTDEAMGKFREALAKHGRDQVQLIVMHPPYHDIIQFSQDPRDRSAQGPCRKILSICSLVQYPLCFLKLYWGYMPSKCSISISVTYFATMDAAATAALLASALTMENCLMFVMGIVTASTMSASGVLVRSSTAYCIAVIVSRRMLILSISMLSIMPTPISTAETRISQNRNARSFSGTFFESLSPSILSALGRITAAATTGPANGAPSSFIYACDYRKSLASEGIVMPVDVHEKKLLRRKFFFFYLCGFALLGRAARALQVGGLVRTTYLALQGQTMSVLPEVHFPSQRRSP